ncbi:MAG: flippase-like domain-containing protein [Candidatus Bathyarchaeota archaeon]|nr:flippase-like domain-containing protein [Candidatus Bathyarchaeota archaeon]
METNSSAAEVGKRLRLIGGKTLAFMAIGLVAFFLYLYFFVGFDSLITLLSSLNVYQYSLFFALAVAALFAGVVFDSLIWHSLLESLSVKVKFRKLLLFNWIGNFIELIIPSATIGGELARIALAQKETKHDTGIAAATVIGSRLISTFVYSGGLLVAFTLLLISGQLPLYLVTPVILVMAGTGAAVGCIFLIAFRDDAVGKLVSVAMWVIKRVIKDPARQKSLETKISGGLSSFSGVFRSFKDHPRQLIKPALYATVAWLFNLVVYLMVFYALDFTAISLVDLATVYCIITTVETLTAGVPVGAVEVTMVSLFALYGVPLVIAGAATTIARLLTFWGQVIVGYPLVQWIGAKSLVKGGKANPLSIKPQVSSGIN